MTNGTPRQVFHDRLFKAPSGRRSTQYLARMMCGFLVTTFGVVTAILSAACGRRRRGTRRRAGSRVVLTGTFFADNWIEAHVRPLACSPLCEHVWVVADRPFTPLEHVTYVCPPKWLQRTLGRVPARSIMCVLTAIRRRADVVGGFHVLLNGLLALMVARMIGARAMYFCVGGWAEFVDGGVHGGNKLFTLMGQGHPGMQEALLRAIRQFDVILTMGSGARDYLRSFDVATPIHVMPGAIDTALYDQVVREEPEYDLITVCRLAPVKRLDNFLKVVQRVNDSLPGTTAAIVGDGEDMAALQEQARTLGLSDNVFFVGRKNNVQRWLCRSRIFLLTSDSEGLSLALMEAGMAGLPAVVSDVGDLGDLIDNGVNGWRVAPGDIETFAEHIVTLLRDPACYARSALAAREAASAVSLETICSRWDAVLGSWGFVAANSDSALPPAKTRFIPSRKDFWQMSVNVTRHPAARMLSYASPSLWLGRGFRRKLNWLQQMDRASHDEIHAYQLARLKDLVRHAYQRCPHYRRLYREHGCESGDIRSLEAFQQLPTIDASQVRRHLASMCTTQWSLGRADFVATAGTGGQPLHFYIDADRSVAEYAHLTASWARAGYHLRIPLVVFRGGQVQSSNGVPIQYDSLLRHHHCSTFHMSDENMAAYLEHIGGLGDCYLHVYPSAAAALARFLKRSGRVAPSNIRGILAESEIVYPDQRTMISEVFNCRMFSCYGHTEKAVLAAECEHSSDYHFWPTYGFAELLDADGHPIDTPGQRGEIVGTSFGNSIVPFIRYRTGDYGTYVAQNCAHCGRSQLILNDIRGHRTQEILIAKDGSEVPWAALNMHDRTFEHVRAFQFFQDTPGHAILKIDPGIGFEEGTKQRILDALSSKLDGRIEITIQQDTAIKWGARGKALYVDQRVTNGHGARQHISN